MLIMILLMTQERLQFKMHIGTTLTSTVATLLTPYLRTQHLLKAYIFVNPAICIVYFLDENLMRNRI